MGAADELYAESSKLLGVITISSELGLEMHNSNYCAVFWAHFRSYLNNSNRLFFRIYQYNILIKKSNWSDINNSSSIKSHMY